MPSSLKDAFRIARAMASVVVGYAPNPALPGFPALFGRPKEVCDLVVAGVDVGLDRGRQPGLPLAIAKVARPNTQTESLTHCAKTFAVSKKARLPDMC
jgi:hypothetical protein